MSIIALAAAAAMWGFAFWLPGGAPALVRSGAALLAGWLTLMMPIAAMRDVAGEASGGSIVGRGVALLFVALHLIGWLAVWRQLDNQVRPGGEVHGEWTNDQLLRFALPVLEWIPVVFAALAAASTFILTVAAFSWLWSRR